MQLDMHSIYLNNEIIADEKSWPIIRCKINGLNKTKVVLSIYNLIEMTDGICRSQVYRRIEFIESLDPIWIRDRRDMQKEEVRNFVWETCFNTPMNAVVPFNRNLSAVLAYHYGSKTPLNCSVRQWLDKFGGCLHLDGPKTATVQALKIIQTAKQKKVDLATNQTFLNWIHKSLPYRDPRNRIITGAERFILAEYCLDHRIEFFNYCKSMAVEDKMEEIRTHDPNRVPTKQDAIDRHHISVALPYCDYFISKDKYLIHCASYVRRALPSAKLAVVLRSVNDIADPTSKLI